MHKCRPNNSEPFRLDRPQLFSGVSFATCVSPNYQEDAISFLFLTHSNLSIYTNTYTKHCILHTKYTHIYILTRDQATERDVAEMLERCDYTCLQLVYNLINTIIRSSMETRIKGENTKKKNNDQPIPLPFAYFLYVQ